MAMITGAAIGMLVGGRLGPTVGSAVIAYNAVNLVILVHKRAQLAAMEERDDE
jgi:hypothetical protein